MKNILLLVFCWAIFATLFTTGCNKLENVTNSGSKLILETVTGADLEGNDGSTIAFSDVVKDGSIINDNGQASFSAQLLNPNQSDSTYYQDIVIDQVDVEYSRSDGLNVQGRDVPYHFSQQIHAKVEISGNTTIGFVLIQHNAKLESPLVDLTNAGQEHILKLEAKITFYGKDLGGNRVEPAVGHISIWCANFADATN